MIPELIGATSLAIWLYLLLAHGQFWRVSEPILLSLPSPATAPRCAVIIPARNEAAVIAQSITSVLQQDYAGHIHVFLIDDHSSDFTATVARSAAARLSREDQLTIVPSEPLPPGWTGKLWAVSQGIHQAANFQPEWFWLTDADVVHGPATLRSLVGKACSDGFDLVSLMVKLRCQSWAERALIPTFVFFFFKLYPPRWVADAKHKTAAAAGGCILVRATSLAAIGGIGAIRHHLIDDCALAAKVKQVGRIWLGLAGDSHSIRGYGSWRDIEHMVSRSAFTQLNHSSLLLLATVAGMTLTYLAAPIVVWFGSGAAVLGGTAWLFMAAAYSPMLRFYRRSVLWAAALPLMAAFYAAATLHSAFLYWMGRGGEWKGRVQDPVARSS